MAITLVTTAASAATAMEKVKRHLGLDETRAKVAASVTFYIIAALVMVMGNKWVLNASALPLLLLVLQMMASVALLHLVALLKLPFGEGNTVYVTPRLFPARKTTLPSWEDCSSLVEIVRSLAPVLSVNVLGLIFNTYCLQYVSASLFQVVRGLGLPFTVLLSTIYLDQPMGLPVLSSCAIVTLGFLIGVSPGAARSVSLLAIFLGLSSSLCIAAHGILIKKSFTKVTGTLDMAYHINLYSGILLLPIAALTGEVESLLFMARYDPTGLRVFLTGGLLTGLFGFLICVAGLLSVKVTSPVTHMVSSAVRGVLQMLLGIAIFADRLSLNQIASIMIILLGSARYTWVKELELRAKMQSNLPMKEYRKAESEERPDEIVIDFDVESMEEDPPSFASGK